MIRDSAAEHLWPSSLPVYAGFGVCNFVQAGDFEAICTSPLALVHVVPKGQNYLQELPQTLASDEFFGCQKNGLKKKSRKKEKKKKRNSSIHSGCF